MKISDGIKRLMLILLILLFCMIGIIMFLGKKEEKKPTSLIVFDDLISEQALVDKQIKELTEETKYRYDSPYIYNNPYSISPLTSLIIFETEKKESIEVFIDGERCYKSSVTNEHVVPLVGLKANIENEIVIKTSEGEHQFVIKPSIAGISGSQVAVESKNSFYLTSSLDSKLNYLIYDGKGNIRWYLDLKAYGSLESLNNNTFIVPVLENQDGVSDGIYIIDYMGKIKTRIDSKYGYKSDLEVIDDKTVIINGKDTNIYTMNIEDGTIIHEVNVLDVFKKIDDKFNQELDITAIDYRDGELLISVTNLNMILNIDYNNKIIKWIYGNPDNFSNKFKPYLLNVDSNIRYIENPEQVMFMRNGISVYGNINNKESKGFMLVIDNNSKTARLYVDLEENVLSSKYGGFVTYLDSDLVTYSSIKEGEGIISKIIEYNNLGTKIYESVVNSDLYRTEKVLLPSYNTNYDVLDYKYITNEESNIIELSDVVVDEKKRNTFKLYRNCYEVMLDDGEYDTFSLILKNDDEEIIIPYKGRKTYYDINMGYYKLYVHIDDTFYDLSKEVSYN